MIDSSSGITAVPQLQVVQVAQAKFPSEFGIFQIHGFEGRFEGRLEECVVLRMGELSPAVPPLVRVHSQCLTGDVFHSLRCDCHAQLEMALELIAESGYGLLIYEQKEGRGIGLMNKLRAYELQDQGADTVEANEQLGFKADLRSYLMPAAILRYMGVNSVRLLSNNPEKIQALEDGGVRVVERVPCQVQPHANTRDYLRVKKEKMGHLL